MLTAYDFTMARILDRAGVDVILVGDSASNVFSGHNTTLPITIDEMIYHARAVVKGVQAETSRAMVSYRHAVHELSAFRRGGAAQCRQNHEGA